MKKQIVKESLDFLDGTNVSASLEKVLRHYGGDVRLFIEEGELSDHLFDALYDYYFDEMPYGTKKARDGDPYEWVSEKLEKELGLHNTQDPHDLDDPAPMEEGAAGDIMPLDETHPSCPEGYHEEIRCPYCGEEAEHEGAPCCSEVHTRTVYVNDNDPDDELDPYSLPDTDPYDEGDLADFAYDQQRDDELLASADLDENYGDYDFGVNADSVIRRSDEFGEHGEPRFADHPWSADDKELDEAFLVEDNEKLITHILEQIGLDNGLDFFFDNGLVAIGRSTARVIINALKADRRIKEVPSFGRMDGEEVQIVFNKQEKPVFKDTKIDDIAPAEFDVEAPNELAMESKIKEDVSVNINASGEEDVLDIIRKLSGMSSESKAEITATPVVSSTPSIASSPTLAALMARMSDISSGNNDEECATCDDVELAEDFGHADVNNKDGAVYDNSPATRTHTSTADQLTRGNDLNRAKRQDYTIRNPGNNPMAETKQMPETNKLLKQYNFLKGEIKAK